MNERANLDRLTPGMAAFDALGAPVGTVEVVGAGTFRVAGQELPTSAIDRIDTAGVHLHLARTVLGATSTQAAVGERSTAWDDDRLVIPLAEERLHVGTREVELGEVLIRKRVVTEEQLVPVTFRREEVEIIRRAPGEDWPPGTPLADAAITRIPLQGWDPVIGTEAVITREVVVEKARVAEDGQITGTIRREHATVDERYAQVRPALEREFHAAQTTAGAGATPRTFAEAEPHYRAGFQAGSDPRYAGRDFAEVESAVRGEYDTAGQHDDDAWARLRQEIRAGYEAVGRQ